MSLMKEYFLLGRSGLRVSPLCLGTMTFGTEWGWGSAEGTAREIFRAYVEAGGNFIDTADMYTSGTSEQLVGKFIAETNLRDKLVLATKYTFNGDPGNPNAGGNSRKNLYRAVEGSLKRLKTDYIDLYWMHVWDGMTPVEEVTHTMNALVGAGKIRNFGLSDCPAWYVSRARTIAELRGLDPVCAIQMEYNLAERTIEHEFVPMVQELGMGTCTWSPLANGFFSGKYSRDRSSEGRLKSDGANANPIMQRVLSKDQNWKILETLIEISKEIDRHPAQVALNWIAKRPGISSTIIGATKLDQLKVNLSSLDFEIPAPLEKKLTDVSQPEMGTPYMFFEPGMRKMITGGVAVSREPAWFR